MKSLIKLSFSKQGMQCVIIQRVKEYSQPVSSYYTTYSKRFNLKLCLASLQPCTIDTDIQSLFFFSTNSHGLCSETYDSSSSKLMLSNNIARSWVFTYRIEHFSCILTHISNMNVLGCTVENKDKICFHINTCHFNIWHQNHI